MSTHSRKTPFTSRAFDLFSERIRLPAWKLLHWNEEQYEVSDLQAFDIQKSEFFSSKFRREKKGGGGGREEYHVSWEVMTCLSMNFLAAKVQLQKRRKVLSKQSIGGANHCSPTIACRSNALSPQRLPTPLSSSGYCRCYLWPFELNFTAVFHKLNTILWVSQLVKSDDEFMCIQRLSSSKNALRHSGQPGDSFSGIGT